MRRSLFMTSGSSSSSSEIDLRKEFDNLIYGTYGGLPHGYKIVIRRMRRDSSGVPEACVCRDAMTYEADPDCSYCGGEGALWDEEWADTYSMFVGSDTGLTRKSIYLSPGSIRVDYKLFFLRYNTSVRYGDKLIEMKLDEEGKVVVPYKRKTIYKPETIQEFRSDNGRIEYLGIHCREEDAIRNDYI